jgi:DNA gyrase subunit A
MGMEDVRIMGRATQGVRFIKIEEGDEIAAVAKIELEEGEAEELMEENGEDALEKDTDGNNSDSE